MPVLEAMHLGLPVVAFAEAAVPETVAGAGLLVEAKRPLDVAAAVERITHDQALRAALVGRGRRRAGDFAVARPGRPSSRPWGLCGCRPFAVIAMVGLGPETRASTPTARAATASVRRFSQCRQGLRTSPDFEVVVDVASAH